MFLSFISSLFSKCSCSASKVPIDRTTLDPEKNSIHQFNVESLSGDLFDFKSLKGKKVMIVNTASKCGLTPQYKDLQELYERYKDQDFEIIGFPCNDFMGQEPGDHQQIHSFCTKNYGVSFPMMKKITVKGTEKHEVYSFLTQKLKNGVMHSKVSWNFQKYLIDSQGFLVDKIAPRVSPLDSTVISWIESEK